MQLSVKTLLFPSSAKDALRLLGLAATTVLALALVMQYGFDLHPCDLCLMQRYPYAAAAVTAFAASYLACPARLRRAAILLVVLLFVVDAGIAFYHTGVEQGWFKGPDACSAQSEDEMTLEEMRKAILEAPLVSCNQAMAHVFGLSLAAWNTLAALALAFWGLILWRRAA